MTNSSKLLADISKYDDVQRSILKQSLGPGLVERLGPPGLSVVEKAALRSEAWQRTGSDEDSALVAALLRLITSADFEVAIAAAWEFHWHPELASPDLRDRLLTMLSSRNHKVRACAALVFGQLGSAMKSQLVTRELLRLAAKDEHEEVRAAVLLSLGSMGSTEASVGDTLFRGLQDNSALVRIFAIRGIGELCSEDCETEVIERLSGLMVRDSDERVRATADEVCARLVHQISAEEELSHSLVELSAHGTDQSLGSGTGNGGISVADSKPQAGQTMLLLWNDTSIDYSHVALVLRRLRNLVRIGTRVPSSAEKWQQLVSANLLALKDWKGDRILSSEVDTLDLAILEAEFEDRCGRYENAVSILEETIPDLLGGYIDHWLERATPTTDELPLLRLRIWVSMTYAWVRHYRFGDYDEAKARLDSVTECISGFRNEEHPWYGTRSRLEYYRGHCLRGMRDFKKAEYCFTEAAALADKRREFRLAHGGKRSFECAWAMVTTARVQGAGLGWSLLQRGRLSEARRHLLFAQNVLNTTGEEFTKLFNRSLLLIVDRRMTDTGEPEYRRALGKLYECVWEYARLKDATGQLRCLHELCLGFLDICEFQRDDTCRQEAKAVLAQIATLCHHTQDQRWHLRYDLLRARYELTPLGEIPGRDTVVSRETFRELVKTTTQYLARDPSNGRLLIMYGLLLWVEGEHGQACEKFSAASEHAGPSDLVLTREALLLRAWCIATEIVTEVENTAGVDLEIIQKRLDHLTTEGALAYEEAGHNFGDLRLAETENAYLRELTKRAERVRAYASDGLSKLKRRFAMKDPECSRTCTDPMSGPGSETERAVTGQRPASIRGIRT